MEKLIEQILKKREERLPQIQQKIDELNKLLKELNNYETLRTRIIDSEGKLRTDSPLYAELIKYPEMVEKINLADSGEVTTAVREYIIKLERLAQRFSRKSIAIQVFGEAGSGKSTFIQSVTGLDNNVVLASSGDHCTGTTSYIKNAPNFEARIYPYTRAEILQAFNSIIREVRSSVTTNKTMNELASFDEIKRFRVEDYGLRKQEDRDALSVYVDHFDDITSIIDKIEREGLVDTEHDNEKYLRIVNPDEVQQYVAQHNGGEDSGKPVVRYFNFLGVKYVRIFKDFKYKKAGAVEIMDSVGYGDAKTEKTLKTSMSQSVADNCDVVIVLSAPVTAREYSNSCQLMDDIHFDEKGKERISTDCLFMVLNRREKGNRLTVQGCKDFTDKWMGLSDDGTKARKESLFESNLSDPNETEVKVIVPILEQVSSRLEAIDDSIRKDVDKEGQVVQASFQSFLKQVSSVLLGNISGGEDVKLWELFKEMYYKNLRVEFNNVLKAAKDEKESTADSLHRSLRVLCNEDNLKKYLSEIEPVIDRQLEYTDRISEAYENVANTLRHTLPNKFRSIDSQLDEEVEKRKAAIFRVLLNTGRWNTILKAENPENDAYVNRWMQEFNNLILDQENYPILHNLVQNLLDFKIDIDGFLIYRIIKHLNAFDNRPNPNNVAPERVKDAIVFYLNRNIRDAFSSINTELKDFTQSPSQATYFAMEEFQVGFQLYPESEKELYKLYSVYKNQIWRAEFEQIFSRQVTLKEWTDERNALEAYNSSRIF